MDKFIFLAMCWARWHGDKYLIRQDERAGFSPASWKRNKERP